MSKNKKGKVVSIKPVQASPEKYIKTQARSLPVAECLITKDWEGAGICNVFVARAHKTGNITVGIYLVDMYCLGLKDTTYEFNISPDDYENLKSSTAELEECEYTLAHNIIYGAIAFAEDYGFKPHKDFSISQFILEEDDEQVELMELDFGFDGQPCYMLGPYDDAAKIKHVMATLERTAGPGNFTVVDPLDEEWDDDDEEYDEDDPEYDDGEFDYDSLKEDLDESYARFPKILKKINKVYDGLIRTPEAKEALEKSIIGTTYKIIRKGEVKNEYTTFDSDEQESEYNSLKRLIMDSDDYEFTIKSIKAAIKKYPDKPTFYDLLIPVYHFNNKYDEQDKLVTDMYKRFPDYLYPKIAYAILLINDGKAADVLAVFNGKPDLNYLYPGKKAFPIREVADYYACMCRYFIAMDDMDSADEYMNAVFKRKLTKAPGKTLVNIAAAELCNVKMKKVLALSGHSEE